MTTGAITGDVRAKILTADAYPLMREALARLIAEILARESFARIMMEAGPTAEILEAESLAAIQDQLTAHSDVTLVVLDIALPDASGTEAIDRILSLRPGLPILVLSARDDPTTVRAALAHGAWAFVSKRRPTRDLIEALRLMLASGTDTPAEALRATVSRNGEQDEEPSADPNEPNAAVREVLGLTRRQFDVLKLLVQGTPNKLICRSLSLAQGTVKTHTAAIYRALRVSNRTQAVYAVSRFGLPYPSDGLRSGARHAA